MAYLLRLDYSRSSRVSLGPPAVRQEAEWCWLVGQLTQRTSSAVQPLGVPPASRETGFVEAVETETLPKKSVQEHTYLDLWCESF